MTTIGPKASNVLKQLEQDEQIESLHYLVDKLPQFISSVKVIEDKVDFLVNTLSDKQSLSMAVEDTEKKIEQLRINEEHLNAMVELVHTLPRLIPVVKKLENLKLFVEDVANDEKTFNALVAGVNDVVPIQKSVDIIEETNRHFKENEDMSPVSIFGLMRMLKDPTVQHGLKYFQSLLYVIGNQEK